MTQRLLLAVLLLVLGAALPARADGLPGLILARGNLYAPGGDIRNGSSVVTETALVLPAGSTLDFANLDTVSHNVTSGDPVVDGVQGDGLFRSEFANAITIDREPKPVVGVESLGVGPYRFFCQNHPGQLQGTLVIV